MRWRFIDPGNQSEAVERSAISDRIDSWWREFQLKSDEIVASFSRQANLDLPDWMEQHLGAVDLDLCWEYGAAVRGQGHRLVITPESRHDLRPLVRAILAAAPALHGWEFYEYRLAEDLESTLLTVEARTGRDITDFTVRASLSEHQCINLIYTSPSITDGDDSSARQAAFVATETLLGEQCLNQWLGAIEIAPMPRRWGPKWLFGRDEKNAPRSIGLDRLHETVNALIGSIREQLPKNPHYQWVEHAKWTLWELKPEEADDYCGQLDLFLGKAANPTQWTAAHGGGRFSSERFSRCGETFCYVKIDGSQGLDAEGLSDKSEIEDALDEVLKPNRLGCYIGGGTGMRYSYIDLALTDLDKGIEATRQRLREGKVPKRSWIQFFDSDLAAEWIGIYDDSPPPPTVLTS